MRYYFAYGSNMDFDQLKERCPSAQFVSIGYLKDHALKFTIYSPVRFCGCADIVFSQDCLVFGVVYKLSEDDLRKLDYFENVPHSYVRVKRNIMVGNIAQLIDTYTVLSKDKHTPSKKYMRHLISGAKKFGLPEEYVKFLKRIKTIG